MHSFAKRGSYPLCVLLFCSFDKVYHKLEVSLLLYLLGQLSPDNHNPKILH